ncbi:MAG: hypothetical protein EXR72_07390 [Myxococcales bacterium]|nr:hypothetical protein [Myxococcales bacterium]
MRERRDAPSKAAPHRARTRRRGRGGAHRDRARSPRSRPTAPPRGAGAAGDRPSLPRPRC